jgi:hypothetical protein
VGLCDAGYFCSAGNINAQGGISINEKSSPCTGQGSYCPIGSSDGKGRCSAGYYCPDPAQQIACNIGSVCAAAGLTVSSPAARGSYSDVTGLTAGKQCPAGRFCSVTGLSAPDGVCFAGYYCSGWAMNGYGSKMLPDGDAMPNAPCSQGIQVAALVL